MNVESKIDNDYKSKDDQEQTQTPGDQSVVALAAEYAASLTIEEPKAPEEKPSSDILNAQAALDDVKVVLPDGMKVQSHGPKEIPKIED